MRRQRRTINSFTLAVGLVLLFGGVAYGLTQVTRDVSATVDVQISAPNGIEIYLDAARTLPANNIAFGTVVVDPFGTPYGQVVNPVPVWVENQSNSVIQLTLTDDFSLGDVALRGSNQAPILQPGEVLPAELLLKFHQGVAGTYPFTMTFQAEGPVPPPIIQEKLTILVGSWGGRFAPLYDNDCHAYGINHGGFLIRSDRNRQYIDGLATAWVVSADGLTWTFTIRDDATFHDGTPVTVEDVEFTWRQTWGPGALDVATSPTASANAINTSNIEISGTNQVSVTHHELNPSFLNSMSDATSSCQGVVLPKHFWDGYEVHDQGRALAYDQNPIAAGPLRIREIRPGELMAFESFADYYAKDRAIKIQNVNLIKAPEEATRVAALRAGEADIVPVSLAYREQVEAGGGRLLFGPEGNYISVRLDGCWHDSDFSCGDKRVRQALEYAIDKELIRDRLYGGPEVFQVKGWAHVTPSSIGYSTHLNPYLYDPDKARRLLAEAGYKTLTNPEGKDFGKLIVNTWVSSSIPLLPESAQLAADFWRRELGIDAEVRVGDEALIKAIRRDGGLAGQVTWGDNRDRLDGYSISRSNYATPEQTDRLSNDPELHALAKATLSVTDLTERPQAMNQLYRRLRDETHELGIGYANIPWGVGPRVESWTPQPMALYPSALHTAILK